MFFLFEYIGEMGKDYIYVVIFLLEDVFMDRLEFLMLIFERDFLVLNEIMCIK